MANAPILPPERVELRVPAFVKVAPFSAYTPIEDVPLEFITPPALFVNEAPALVTITPTELFPVKVTVPVDAESPPLKYIPYPSAAFIVAFPLFATSVSIKYAPIPFAFKVTFPLLVNGARVDPYIPISSLLPDIISISVLFCVEPVP